MADAVINIDGAPVTECTIYVPGVGVPVVDANIVDDLPVSSGQVTLSVGSFTLVGTIDPAHAGVFALSRRVRLLGGAGGWSQTLLPLSYPPNDAGIRASDVALDAARAVGETLGSFAGGQVTLGSHYLRSAGVASRTLEDVARGVPWYVDFDGVTRVGVRASFAVDPANVRLLEFDVRLNLATLAVDDLTGFGVGAVISDERLDAPITVNSYEVRVVAEEIRVMAWCDSTTQTPVIDALRTLVARVAPARLFGKFRYRVVTIDGGNAGRLNLQAVKPSAGVPDTLSLPMAVACGIHAKPALGSTCFVEFVAGDVADPIVTAFQGRGGPGFVPQGITLASDDDTAPNAARQGDGVTVVMPPMVFTGTIGGTPFTAVGQATTGQILGTISAGSSKVKIGT